MKFHATIKIDPPDEGIIVIDNITIDPEPIEVKSIVGTTIVPGWTVSIWRTISGYPHSPDDVADDVKGEARSPEQAAVLAIQVIFDEIADAYWEKVAMSQPVVPVDDLFPI